MRLEAWFVLDALKCQEIIVGEVADATNIRILVHLLVGLFRGVPDKDWLVRRDTTFAPVAMGLVIVATYAGMSVAIDLGVPIITYHYRSSESRSRGSQHMFHEEPSCGTSRQANMLWMQQPTHAAKDIAWSLAAAPKCIRLAIAAFSVDGRNEAEYSDQHASESTHN